MVLLAISAFLQFSLEYYLYSFLPLSQVTPKRTTVGEI